MTLTEQEIAHIRESMRWLQSEIERVAPKFYEDLFRRDPALRAMFREDLTDQGMRFMSAIRVITDHLDAPDDLEREVALLADGHAAMSINAAAYHTMEEALIDTLRAGLGARFNREMQLAWRGAFRQIGEAMLARGGQDPDLVSPVSPLN
ncbi:MAG: globin domain-containing protein [Paracoccaceae bacterium]